MVIAKPFKGVPDTPINEAPKSPAFWRKDEWQSEYDGERRSRHMRSRHTNRSSLTNTARDDDVAISTD